MTQLGMLIDEIDHKRRMREIQELGRLQREVLDGMEGLMDRIHDVRVQQQRNGARIDKLTEAFGGTVDRLCETAKSLS